MTEVTIYSAKVCPFAQRTRLTLLEKQVDFKLIEIDLNDTPNWFLEISPYGKIPALKRGDDLVCESAIINEYLEEVYPEPALMPSRPGQRAYARFWIDFANTKFVPWFYKLLLAQRPERQEQFAAELRDHLLFMERKGLGDVQAGSYWLGDRPSLVDLAFYPFFERLPVLEYYRDFTLPDECPQLSAWWSTMRQRASVQQLMNPAEFYIHSYTHYADGSASGSTAQDMRST